MDLKTGLIAWALTNGKRGWIDPKLRVKKDPTITVNLWVKRDGFTRDGDVVLRRPNGPANYMGYGPPKLIHHSKIVKRVTVDRMSCVTTDVTTALALM